VDGAWGPACRFKVDPTACTVTQLNQYIASPNYSCGAVGKVVGAGGNTGKIFANVVTSGSIPATHYRFEFSVTGEGYLRNVVSTNAVCVLGVWQTNPLLCGTYTYDVRVQASFDGGTTYCPFGPVCTVGITNNQPTPYCTLTVPVAVCQNGFTEPGELCDDGNLTNGDGCDNNCTPTACGNGILTNGEQCDDGNLIPGDGCDATCQFEGPSIPLRAVLGTQPHFAMYPNPNRGDQLFMNMSGFDTTVGIVTVEIFDGFGKRSMTATLPVQNGMLNTALELTPDMAAGLYMVHVTAGDITTTERLMIQR